jgi:tRNA threonylcarbamoyladenosine modification (KEOPS) complex Cgi121 subunit
MIRNIFLTIILVIGLNFAVAAQTDNRTRETKIADIVMLLPADNTAKFNSLMNELYSLGDVIKDLAPRLTEPGGNDAQIRSAISGLTMTSSKNAERKAAVEKSLIAAISAAKSDEIRDFLLIQLQYVAGAASVETVSKYLSNARLCDAAARVLIRVNSKEANEALLNAFKQAKPEQQITLVQALGEVAYEPASAQIAPLISSADVKLKKVALYALANIASPDSEKSLNSAASQVNYLQEPSDALGAYLLYIDNRLAKQDKKQASSAAKKLLKATSEDKQIAAKTAALELYVAAEGEKAASEAFNALKSGNKQYRVAALNFISKTKSAKVYAALVSKLGKEKNSEIRAEIISSLVNYDNQDVFAVVSKYLSDDNAIKRSAIAVAGKTGKEKAVVPILSAINTDDKDIVAVGKSTLLSIKSDKLIAEIAAALPKARPAAAIALLDILSSHKAANQFDVIYAQATAADEGVRTAACKALKDVAGEKNAPLIAQLLNAATTKEQTAYLQDALYSSISSLPQEEQAKRVTGLLKTGRKPALYYNVLAKIGGRDALKVTLPGMNGADGDAAFEALSNWSDASALPALFDIAKAKTKYSEKALNSYVLKVNKSQNKPEQKLLLLRNALEIATTGAQKQEIIKQIAGTGSFLGLITAGKYLDDSNVGVQQAAVQAVRKIATANPAYYGSEVAALLNKAVAVNKDSEAEYQKQEIQKHLSSLPKDDGFVSLFNGKDLTGWKGLVEDPIKRSKMKAKQLDEKQKKADENMRRDWRVENGLLVFDGKGYDNLCTVKDYADFEMYVDWKIAPEGDAGIYLRGTPQVQIWDTSRVDVGAQVGSGGLYNNQKNASKPLVVADNAVNEWNSFYIRMIGDKVTVYLNGQLVTDNVVLENYWDRSLPIFPKEQIELQAHGTRVEYRDIYVREIPRPEPYRVSDAEKAEGFVPMFNGIDMNGWIGNLKDYVARNGAIACIPSSGGHGNLYTEKEYSNFVMRFEFKLTPAANNGLGIRTPLEGDAAYVGMELQILDNEADVYKDLAVYQYHGSVYGVIPAKRGYLKPTGEWNTQEVVANGNKIKVTLNGVVILDGDIAEASKNFTATTDKQRHPGLSNKKGHIGFLGHGSELEFRNLRIKEL